MISTTGRHCAVAALFAVATVGSTPGAARAEDRLLTEAVNFSGAIR